MKKLISVLLLLTMILTVTGCGEDVGTETASAGEDQTDKQEEVTTESTTEAVSTEEAETEEVPEEAVTNACPEFVLSETETSVTYMNALGDETTITKNPEKVVIVYNTILGQWYYGGGTSLTKVKGSTNVPEAAKDNDDLGSISSVSLEAIVAYEPDLVVLPANYSKQVEMAPMLEQMDIEVMILDAVNNPWARFRENLYLISLVNGTEELYDEKVQPIITHVEEVVTQATAVGTEPTFAVIFASSKSLKLETNIAVSGESMTMLGGKNIVNDNNLVIKGEARIEFSIEAIIAANPELITIATMGDIDACKEQVEKMIAENPAWQELDAVKNGNIHYMPKEISVYKPNERYDEAFDYYASILYPSVFGE